MPASDYVKLEQRLVLAAWAGEQLGYASNKAMLENLREVEEGFASNGLSHLVATILARGPKRLVPEEDLVRYDANVRSHLAYLVTQNVRDARGAAQFGVQVLRPAEFLELVRKAA